MLTCKKDEKKRCWGPDNMQKVVRGADNMQKKINTKNYWKIEEEIVREDPRFRSRINTTWKNLQITKHKSVRYTLVKRDCFADFVLRDWQIFSGSVYHLEEPHVQSLFYFQLFWRWKFDLFFQLKDRWRSRYSIISLWSFDHLSRHLREAAAERRVHVFFFWQRKV